METKAKRRRVILKYLMELGYPFDKAEQYVAMHLPHLLSNREH